MDLHATIMLFAKIEDWLFPALIAVLTATLLLRLYNARRRAAAADSKSSGREARASRTGSWTPEADSLASRSGIPDAVARWELHLEERGRAIAAEVDSKLRLLQVYVSEADRVSSRLESVLERLEALVREQGLDPSELLEQVGRLPSREALSVDGSGNSDKDLESSEIRSQIGVLWDYGFAVGDIASRMGLTSDQVIEILESRKSNS